MKSAQLFRDSGIAGNSALDLIIRLNLVLVVELGEVEIDPHRDGNNRAKQQNDSEELEVPVALDSICNDDGSGEDHH